VSPARQIAAEATDPEPPALTVAPVGLDEKKGMREVGAVDADNLTEILNQPSLSPVPTAKIE
jgi:hypothetical protein